MSVFISLVFSFLLFGNLYAMKEDPADVDKKALYATAKEKEDLWKKLGLTYAGNNLSDPGFGSLNLMDYELRAKVSAPIIKHFEKLNLEVQKELAASFETLSDMEALEANLSRIRLVVDSLKNTPRSIPFQKDLFLDLSVYKILKELGTESFVYDFAERKRDLYVDTIAIKYVEEIKGYGAFAQKEIGENTIIGKYTGQLRYVVSKSEGMAFNAHLDTISEAEFYERCFFKKADDVCYTLLLADRHPYFLGKDLIPASILIDAKTYRNEMAFLNHSERFFNVKPIRSLEVVLGEKAGNLVIESLTPAVYFLSSRHIKKGEQLLFDYQYNDEMMKMLPFALLDLKPTLSCYSCNKADKKLNLCSACKIARYCSRQCQKNDWKAHKKHCKKGS